VLELKRGSDTEAAMAYLFKHTKLQKRFHVNLTCLVPTEDAEVGAPRQVDLRTILRHFLDFRMEVVVRRLKNELQELEQRIHILEGFEIIFDALDYSGVQRQGRCRAAAHAPLSAGSRSGRRRPRDAPL